jgi:hypothetical protein
MIFLKRVIKKNILPQKNKKKYLFLMRSLEKPLPLLVERKKIEE